MSWRVGEHGYRPLFDQQLKQYEDNPFCGILRNYLDPRAYGSTEKVKALKSLRNKTKTLPLESNRLAQFIIDKLGDLPSSTISNRQVLSTERMLSRLNSQKKPILFKLANPAVENWLQAPDPSLILLRNFLSNRQKILSSSEQEEVRSLFRQVLDAHVWTDEQKNVLDKCQVILYNPFQTLSERCWQELDKLLLEMENGQRGAASKCALSVLSDGEVLFKSALQSLHRFLVDPGSPMAHELLAFRHEITSSAQGLQIKTQAARQFAQKLRSYAPTDSTMTEIVNDMHDLLATVGEETELTPQTAFAFLRHIDTLKDRFDFPGLLPSIGLMGKAYYQQGSEPFVEASNLPPSPIREASSVAPSGFATPFHTLLRKAPLAKTVSEIAMNFFNWRLSFLSAYISTCPKIPPSTHISHFIDSMFTPKPPSSVTPVATEALLNHFLTTGKSLKLELLFHCINRLFNLQLSQDKANFSNIDDLLLLFFNAIESLDERGYKRDLLSFVVKKFLFFADTVLESLIPKLAYLCINHLESMTQESGPLEAYPLSRISEALQIYILATRHFKVAPQKNRQSSILESIEQGYDKETKARQNQLFKKANYALVQFFIDTVRLETPIYYMLDKILKKGAAKALRSIIGYLIKPINFIFKKITCSLLSIILNRTSILQSGIRFGIKEFYKNKEGPQIVLSTLIQVFDELYATLLKNDYPPCLPSSDIRVNLTPLVDLPQHILDCVQMDPLMPTSLIPEKSTLQNLPSIFVKELNRLALLMIGSVYERAVDKKTLYPQIRDFLLQLQQPSSSHGSKKLKIILENKIRKVASLLSYSCLTTNPPYKYSPLLEHMIETKKMLDEERDIQSFVLERIENGQNICHDNLGSLTEFEIQAFTRYLTCLQEIAEKYKNNYITDWTKFKININNIIDFTTNNFKDNIKESLPLHGVLEEGIDFTIRQFIRIIDDPNFLHSLVVNGALASVAEGLLDDCKKKTYA